MRIARVIAAVLIGAAWCVGVALMVLAGSLMSIDEEWTGWGDLFLNPYLMVPGVLITLGVVWSISRLIRPSRGDTANRRRHSFRQSVR
jgi:hypothetical protein